MALEIGKKRQKGKTSIFDKIRKNIIGKVKSSMYEVEMLKALKKYKIQVLENLIEEQEFKISLNSINPQERMFKEFFETQLELMSSFSTELNQQITNINSELS